MERPDNPEPERRDMVIRPEPIKAKASRPKIPPPQNPPAPVEDKEK